MKTKHLMYLAGAAALVGVGYVVWRANQPVPVARDASGPSPRPSREGLLGTTIDRDALQSAASVPAPTTSGTTAPGSTLTGGAAVGTAGAVVKSTTLSYDSIMGALTPQPTGTPFAPLPIRRLY